MKEWLTTLVESIKKPKIVFLLIQGYVQEMNKKLDRASLKENSEQNDYVSGGHNCWFAGDLIANHEGKREGDSTSETAICLGSGQ